MPLNIPQIDNRKYQDLVDEALARIPVHLPEWTNFNRSDPGVTLIELFAFLTESLIYRANQIPERNRLKFLSLLGIPLKPPSSARGIVTFGNEAPGGEVVTLEGGVEVRAGEIPFRTTQGLDLLPVEGRVYYKRSIGTVTPELEAYYRQLYDSYGGAAPPLDLSLQLYDTVPLEANRGGVNLGSDAVDHSLWIALLARSGETDAVRERLAGKTLSLGVAPVVSDPQRRIRPGGEANPEGETLLRYSVPDVPEGGLLPRDPALRVARYRQLEHRSPCDVLAEPGVVQVTLPGSPKELLLWKNLDPLEQGVGDFPPALLDTTVEERVVTWIRIDSSAAAGASLLWVGINAAPVSQRARVIAERLPEGTGRPDQAVTLSRRPVIPGTVRLQIGVDPDPWEEVEDLLAAGSEIQLPDPRTPPGSFRAGNGKVKVFRLDPESGELRFGDGMRGMRPPLNAAITASYDFGVGREGNVNAGAISGAPSLPAGITVTNPIPAWGGAEGDSASDGERRIEGYLRHRDRLVSAEDFREITLRTPGVDIGRVEVIPAYSPELGQSQPGDAPGGVTIMVIPKYDPRQPDAPLPDGLFLDTICRYLEPRRLVTTEIFLRPPVYRRIWISVGITVIAARSTSLAEVRETVKRDLLRFLHPLAPPESAAKTPFMYYPGGWPLWNTVHARELVAVTGRADGVSMVNGLLLAVDDKEAQEAVEMKGLELPRVMGLSVTVGDPLPLAQLRGGAGAAAGAAAPAGAGKGEGEGGERRPLFLPIPMIPVECK